MAAGILEPLDQSKGPTPWVSNLVVVPKERPVSNAKLGASRPVSANGMEPEYELAIRLICDSKAVNKAIKRTRYPSKTIEDLLTAVSGVIVFSKLDIIKAFHQLLLSKGSRYLTTITTHVGL